MSILQLVDYCTIYVNESSRISSPKKESVKQQEETWNFKGKRIDNIMEFHHTESNLIKQEKKHGISKEKELAILGNSITRSLTEIPNKIFHSSTKYCHTYTCHII